MRPNRFDVESERANALRATQLLDSHAEEAFEALVGAVAQLLELPVALVALVDEDRQWFKARIGVASDEDARAIASASLALSQSGPFVIVDASDDPRARERELVGAPLHLRFIAGIALRWPTGELLGTLTVADRRPRALTGVQLGALETLARQVLHLIELRTLNAVVRRSNERLKEKNATLDRAAAMIESAPDTMLVVDRKGLCQDLSSTIAIPWESTDETSASIVGRSLDSILGALGRELAPHVQGAIDQRASTTIEREVELDGRRRTLLVMVAPCREDEALVVVRDVSRERELARMKDELVSMIAHEVRTPLSAMRASLGLLDAGAMGALTPEQTELVSISARSAERLTRLVNDVLDLEQLARGPVALRKVPADLHALLTAAAREVRPVAAACGVLIEEQSIEGFRCQIDADRVTQAVVALLGRAVRCSSPGGTVVLRLDAASPGRARLSVRDQSAGLDEEERGRLFQRFERVDVACGETGLGLAIVRSIVEQHGGELGVESERGQGTTLWFELDAQTPPMSALAARWTQEAVAEARREFLAALVTLRDALTTLGLQLDDGGARDRLRGIAHRIAGTAGTCGLCDLSDRARIVEERCEAPTADARSLRAPHEALLAAIDDALRAPRR